MKPRVQVQVRSPRNAERDVTRGNEAGMIVSMMQYRRSHTPAGEEPMSATTFTVAEAAPEVGAPSAELIGRSVR